LRRVKSGTAEIRTEEDVPGVRRYAPFRGCDFQARISPLVTNLRSARE